MYGLHDARAAIAKEDRAIVVEGYTDVLASTRPGSLRLSHPWGRR